MYLLKLCVSLPAIAVLLYAGVRLSLASRWLQIRRLGSAFSSTFQGLECGFTSLAALCTTVGGNLGVGNLSGTAVAIRSGGPGFIVWMILIIALTSIIKYVTCYISMVTKEKIGGRVYGGPVVFLRHSFKTKWASVVVAVVTLICAITVGNLVQVNSLSISMHLIGQPPLAAGMFMAVVLVIMNMMNAERLSGAISKIVPAMTILYLALAAVTLGKFWSNIIPSIKLIYDSAFSISSLRNGAILAFIAETYAMIQVGTLRGIFATDIGLGLEGTVHSMVKSDGLEKDFAAKQSLISLISPFIVAVVTLITTMVLLTTGVWTNQALESTNMCFTAFTHALGSRYTEYLLIFIVFCFSLTTVLTWFLCSKEILSYISHGSSVVEKCWTSLFVFVIPVGALGSVGLLWDVADLSVSVSIIVNTLGIMLLWNKYKDDMFARI
ncbi:MAG: alanine:cation symporter family protein [Aaplasma endosymbiont of Hyalomma asiaticum]